MSDLIAAIATPAGVGGVGILRLSGPKAGETAGRFFTASDGKPLTAHPPGRLVYGSLQDKQGSPIDRILATWSAAPNSYTGEETAELHCHGSPMVLAMALEALFSAGARQAGPGEFTKRAFLNGKLDLTQAEAVADLLEARGREAVRHAAGTLAGTLSAKIEEVYSALTDLMAHFFAVLDYPDEDIDPFRRETMLETLEEQETLLRNLLSASERGSLLRKGVTCAILGKPNAGKSSLLNALAGFDRAIVTDIPGTTRDTLEQEIEVGGVPFRLVDTAGLRESDDPIEQLGVARSRQAMEQADLILVVWDRSSQVTQEDADLLEQAMTQAPTVLVGSKSDLPSAPIPFLNLDLPTVSVSARTGEGLRELETIMAEQVRDLLPQVQAGQYGVLLTNARQTEAVRRALDGVARAKEALEAGLTPDFLLTDVEDAMSALGELTGRTVREDITDRIFSRFCVGK